MSTENAENSKKNEELENKKYKDEKIEKESQVTLDENNSNHRIHLITIIGEIEGHENAGNQSKVTKYELLLPQLASIEDSDEIDGVLLLLNHGRRCRGRAGDRRDGGFSQQTYSFAGSGRQSQYRGSDSGEYGLFVYRSHWHNGGASGADEWHGDRGASDI